MFEHCLKIPSWKALSLNEEAFLVSEQYFAELPENHYSNGIKLLHDRLLYRNWGRLKWMKKLISFRSSHSFDTFQITKYMLWRLSKLSLSYTIVRTRIFKWYKNKWVYSPELIHPMWWFLYFNSNLKTYQFLNSVPFLRIKISWSRNFQ